MNRLVDNWINKHIINSYFNYFNPLIVINIIFSILLGFHYFQFPVNAVMIVVWFLHIASLLLPVTDSLHFIVHVNRSSKRESYYLYETLSSYCQHLWLTPTSNKKYLIHRRWQLFHHIIFIILLSFWCNIYLVGLYVLLIICCFGWLKFIQMYMWVWIEWYLEKYGH